MKPKIYSRFNRRPTEATASGEKEEQTFEMVIDKNGHKSIQPSGYTNIYERIQGSYEETKIENIIARAMGGEMSGLNAHNGQYLDITNAPSTLAEAQQSIQAIKNMFDKLPLEIRNKYNMSVEQYIADFGSENWANIMGVELNKPVTQPAEPTKPVTTEPAATEGKAE